MLDLPTTKHVWSFGFYGRFGRYVCVALFCGFLQSNVYFLHFVHMCGRSAVCAELRPLARKTGSITKTTQERLVHTDHQKYINPSGMLYEIQCNQRT